MRKTGIALVALAFSLAVVVGIDAAAGSGSAPLHLTAASTTAQYNIPEESLAPAAAYVAAVEHAQLVAYLQAIAPRPTHRSGGGGGCTEDQIIARESKGDPRAVNSRSGAAGLYQILDSTWAGREGVTSAADASPEAQRQAYTEIRASNPRAWAASGC